MKRRSVLGMATALAVAAAVGAPQLAVAQPPVPGDPVRVWNEIALDTVRAARNSDAQVARVAAMVNAAMFDAVNGVAARQGGQRYESAIVGVADAPAQAAPEVAVAAAAHSVLSALYPARVATFDAQLEADVEAARGTGRIGAGLLWGGQVGEQVVAARTGDGSTPGETQVGGTAPGQFRADWSGVQFRNLTPFVLDDPGDYVAAGPPALTSAEYAAQFEEVKELGDAARPNQAYLDTYTYWSLGTGTVQPPGEWVKIGINVTNGRDLDLLTKARTFALLGMTLADTAIVTVRTKFTYQWWRPASAIREADIDGNPATVADPGWNPRAGTIGTSPEYYSGHSSFTMAAAVVLAGALGTDDIAFTHVSDSAPGGQARTYPSLTAAAEEAGLSRTLGGIHFRSGNLDGQASGRGIAQEVLATALQPR